MVRRVLLSSLVLLTACAPAAPEPVVPVAKPKPPPEPPKPAAPHATWLFASGTTAASAELDLGDRTLQVGPRGRRWTLAKDKVEHSPVLLAQDLVDVRRQGKQFLFLGVDGTTYLSDDALRAAKVTRPGPVDDAIYAMGKSALLGLDPKGNLFRTTDAGVTWTKGKSPAPATDIVAGLVANARGEALLLVYPQRLFLSVDDGATWAPLATPGIGARRVMRDAAGDLWLEGALTDKLAKLAGSPLRLDVATGPAEFKHAETKSPAPPKSKNEPRRALAGDRLVIVKEEVDPTSKRKKIEVSVSTLGAEPGQPYVLVASASPYTRVRTVGFANNVVVSYDDPQLEPRAVHYVRTTDDGKTWDPLGSLDGPDSASPMIAGPGWLAVGEVCGSAPPCAPPRMKVGTKDWQPLGLPAGARPYAAEFDLKSDRVFILANDAQGTSIFTGKREGPFKRLDLALGKTQPAASSIDRDGNLRLVLRDNWSILTVSGDGAQKPALFLPFQPDGVSLAGDRGYAWKHEQAFETSDAGEHWTKVAAGASGFAQCAASGCLQGSAVRLGWELPDPQKPLLASTAAGTKDAAPAPGPASQAPLEITCKTTGPYKKHEGMFFPAVGHSLEGDVRFVAPIGGEETTTGITVARGTQPPKAIALLSKPPKVKDNVVVRSWSTSSAAGYVAARYSFSRDVKTDADGNKKYNPVDVELGWYNAFTGKNQKVSLPKVKPFRVASSGPSALTAVVEGGLLFLTNRGEAPLYFVRDDGKVETLARPTAVDEFGFSDGVKIGSKIVLAQPRNEDVALVSSSDGGKTWSTTVWTVGEPASLVLFDGSPALMLGLGTFGGELSGVLRFDSVTPDPPTPLRLSAPPVPVTQKGLSVCPKPSGARFHLNGEAPRDVHFTVVGDQDPIDIMTSAAWLRVQADGSTCVDGITAESGDDDLTRFVLLAPADPGHGWLLMRKGWEPKFEARPIECTL